MDSGDWDQRYAATELIWSARPNRWVEAELGDLTPGRALDLAAGECRNAIWLADRGWVVTAVDFSEVALDKGRRLVQGWDADRRNRLVFHRADLLSYVPEPGGFDLVVIAYLQLPPAERHLVMRRAAEALAPGGTLFVVAHDTSNLTEGTGGPQDATVLYTSADLVADLALGGTTVRIERAEPVRRAVEGSDRPAVDALLRAVALGE
jgi:SAM-dependent methyltransferase